MEQCLHIAPGRERQLPREVSFVVVALIAGLVPGCHEDACVWSVARTQSTHSLSAVHRRRGFDPRVVVVGRHLEDEPGFRATVGAPQHRTP